VLVADVEGAGLPDVPVGPLPGDEQAEIRSKERMAAIGSTNLADTFITSTPYSFNSAGTYFSTLRNLALMATIMVLRATSVAAHVMAYLPLLTARVYFRPPYYRFSSPSTSGLS
jgi:hypothetical protein